MTDRRIGQRRAQLLACEQTARDRERERAPEPSWRDLLTEGSSHFVKNTVASGELTQIAEHFAAAASDRLIRPNALRVFRDISRFGKVHKQVARMLARGGIEIRTVSVRAPVAECELEQIFQTWWVMTRMPQEHCRTCGCEPTRCAARTKALSTLGISADILEHNMERFLRVRAEACVSRFNEYLEISPMRSTYISGGFHHFDGDDLVAEINKILSASDTSYKARLSKEGHGRVLHFELIDVPGVSK